MKTRFWYHSKVKAFIFCILTASMAIHAVADSLWKDDTSRSMFADRRAHAVGDILTIIVQENSTTSKDANTKTSKQSGVDIGISKFLYGPEASGLLTKEGQYPALKFNTSSQFDGSGQVGTSEKIIAKIAVRVVDKLPNDTLLIEGSRRTSFAGEKQDVVLRGFVRTDDISSNNTVYSYNIADVEIQFYSRGTATDGQKKGWFTRSWDKVNPF
ncbi:MAG: flagellar basal body L-ring protein FlgH [Verrucomicrobia bacterium]|nr:flagellar basal body L-ring protein FlgH [Verrucomicrobiota bacterium]